MAVLSRTPTRIVAMRNPASSFSATQFQFTQAENHSQPWLNALTSEALGQEVA